MDGSEFERHRAALFAAAYRMLGTRADAEDVVQEAWLRWSRVDQDAVAEPRGYLFRLVTHLAVDQLRRVKARREAYVGPWLPEPLVTAPDDLAEDTELAESVSMGLLVVLETLAPVERAVFVLHEAFGFSHAEIAEMTGRTERAVRQLAYRARQHVLARRPRRRTDAAEHRAVTERFLAAALGGDLTALLDVLAPDVVLVADADGRSETPRQPVRGRREVADYLVAVAGFWPADLGVALRRVNGGPGALITAAGRPFLVFAFDVAADGHRVREINAVLNPDKLAAL
ncbi:RNA polymerase sigma factor SigJ [Goodfellowiella coeruleoviolacea]|uniref:RNA polymerase sigma-70 factor, ECF subfamily n=1 Tax=Goodfellowiella coeruleoviolacea TaxID=334858 RepID=A0AAE3KE50_9PSEU|nr:RNA polymerase sigma factor SigJ [Goodfellowiella coeruleoviolacea]MCP2164916.1 RNA polymerase sigma-70 factor, ECF subfamily [Goodfellowiella coeruleoviolacea]